MRWKEYVEELYDKSGKPLEEDFRLEDEDLVESDQKGPDVMNEEIYAAIRDIKNGKATGIDDIPAEFFENVRRRSTEDAGQIVQGAI